VLGDLLFSEATNRLNYAKRSARLIVGKPHCNTLGGYMTPEELDDLRNDPENRKGGVYYCKEDPRVIVPRSRGLVGWTVNFARPSAIPLLSVMVALVIVPIEYVHTIGGGQFHCLVAGALGVAVVCLWSAYLSSTARWSR
jgi:hypothetical protein